MKKRWWGVLLALAVCVAGLCITAGATAYDEQHDSSIIRIDDYWSDGRPYVKYVDSFDEAIKWMMKDSTFTLLKDVKLDEQLALTAVQLSDRPFYLDLDGHTLSGKRDDEPLILVAPPTGTEIKFWNGTIRNDGAGAAMLLEDGKVTLQNVDVTGSDVVLKNALFYGSNGNYIPTFIGGGTFTRIRLDDNTTLLPSLILSKGCYFTDENGQRVDQNKHYDALENVTAHTCSHKNENGEYTIVPVQGNNYVCSVCGNECPHEDRDEDDVCHACNQQICVKVTYESKYKKPDYCRTFLEATGKGRADVIQLLHDLESSTVFFNGSYLDIDLNGCTLTAHTGDQGQVQLTFRDQTIGMINTSSKLGRYAGTIIVGEYKSPASLNVPAEDNDFTIDKVVYQYGSSTLAGGTYGTIEVKNGITLQSLLASGYYFESTEHDMNIILRDSKTSLRNVTVKKCDHDNYEPKTQSCYCGQKQYYFLQAEMSGSYHKAYFETFAEAERATDNYQDMIIACRPISGTVAVTKNVAIDPAGRDDPLKKNDHLAEAEFEVSGTLRFVHYEDERTIRSVHVLRGGKLELDPKYTTYDNGPLYIKTLTVEDGGKAELTPNQRFDSILLKGENTTYADFAAMLPEGMALQKTDDTWAGNLDLTDVEGGKQLENVRVVPAPITVSAQPADVTITYGDATILPSVTFAAGDAFDANQSASLSWSYRAEGGMQMSTLQEKLTFADGAATATAGFLTSLDAGTYTCYAQLEYGGFRLYSREFTVTIRPRTLRVASMTVADKTYDGATAAEVTNVLFDGVVNNNSIDYDVKNAAFADANAGGNKAVSAMVSLSGKSAVNYSLENGAFTQENAAAILQAAAPAAQPGALTVTNEKAASYTVELAELLPALDEDLEYGTVTYGAVQADLGAYYDDADGAIVDETGKLTLPIRSVASTTEGPIGQVSVTVHSTNFKDMTLTIEVSAKNPPRSNGGAGKPPVKKPETDNSGEHFSDVTERDYFYDAVRWAAENGITGGTGDGQFSPEAPCTRGQLVTLLWRAAGSPGAEHEHGFTDVREGAYYTDAIRWAVREGIIAGYGGGLFGTDDTITREQMALILYRWARTQGQGFTGAWMFRLPFADVGEGAYEAVAWCYMHGVTKGTGSTTFSPKSPCTRAQIVTFLYRLWQVLDQ